MKIDILNDGWILVEPGQMGRNFGKEDMVFCLIYAEDSKPYTKYDYFLSSEDEKEREKANIVVATVCAFMRWDGTIGFPGGYVEPYHKNLIQAIKDELKEEMAFDCIDESKLELLATFANKDRHITTFKYKVSWSKMKEIQMNSYNGKDFYSENTGTFLMQIHPKAMSNYINQVFAGTGKEEFLLLVEEECLMDMEDKNAVEIKEALKLAKSKFSDKLRDNGSNYYHNHILEVYRKTKQMGYSHKHQLVAILHDMYEDTDMSESIIINRFGSDVNDAVKLLTMDKKAPGFNEGESVKRCVKDELAGPVRATDRLSNLEQTSMKSNSIDFVNRIVEKTEKYYLPHFSGNIRELMEKELKRIKEGL